MPTGNNSPNERAYSMVVDDNISITNHQGQEHAVSTAIQAGTTVHHVHHHHHHHHHYNRDELNENVYNIQSGNEINDNNTNSIVENGNTTMAIPNLASISNASISNNANRSDKNGIPFLKLYSSVKTLSLNHLTAKQHLLMAVCRDFSLVLPIMYLFSTMKKSYEVLYAKKNIQLYDIQSITETLALLWQSYKLNKSNTSISDSTLSTAYSTTTSSLSNTSSTLSDSTNSNNSNDISSLLTSLIKPDYSEYLLSAIWCVVSLYLTYSILDSLMVRWIVKYSTVAAIMRMFSMSILILAIELLLLNSFSPQSEYYLHTWILISCILTAVYIWQSYLTSNLNYVSNDDEEYKNDKIINDNNNNSVSDGFQSHPGDNSNSSSSDNLRTRNSGRKKKMPKNYKPFKFSKRRTIDLYKITVFCVVPVGVASFVTMVGLLRNLFIQRLDVQQISMMLKGSYTMEL
ncbi:hypothetical protein TPHA_0F01480 [Tetrapisispora phaffii CBS 4417]|uniref:N-glycosylation protein EOS1 n=1 Tax=Tetrapisispora phaffii (strain ATCC 24235 / CBS 4417 / NBRC 1672 / NRRL Y-8282 / UCD 70-5) TaxID=1071381 RepID=G8BV50_TETPH|nr:hypothetical protein TPHA_0F01480 [Tetrapisispora phaffii CBS 4417]CCE63632.1 hypothetical protein TPHA_0F01480 [Tetrapisispora phaffii CBS 4417]